MLYSLSCKINMTFFLGKQTVLPKTQTPLMNRCCSIGLVRMSNQQCNVLKTEPQYVMFYIFQSESKNKTKNNKHNIERENSTII